MRIRILRGVLGILSTRGTLAETVDELALEIGVAKKTIYNHFPTKTALVNAALALDTEEWLDGIAEILNDASLTLSQKVRSVLDGSLKKLQEREELVLKGRALSVHPDVWNISQVLRTSLVNPVSRLIEEGIEEGAVQPGTDPQMAAFTILNMMLGAIAYAEEPDVPYSPQDLLNESIWLTCQGLLTEKGKREIDPVPGRNRTTGPATREHA